MITKYTEKDIDLSVHEKLELVRGVATKDDYHFYGVIKEKVGDPNKSLADRIGGNLPKVQKGQRNPSNVQTNNPVLSMPNVTAMKYMGALPIFKIAMDQMMPKRIGVYITPNHGAGGNAFEFLNSALYQAEDTLQNILGKSIFGEQASLITETHHLFESLNNMATNVGKIIGGDPSTMINASSAGQLPQLFKGLAMGFANSQTFIKDKNAYNGQQQSPFDDSIFSDGIEMAKDVSAFINNLKGK